MRTLTTTFPVTAAGDFRIIFRNIGAPEAGGGLRLPNLSRVSGLGRLPELRKAFADVRV